jgi:hypothetical protein
LLNRLVELLDGLVWFSTEHVFCTPLGHPLRAMA